MKYSIFDPTGNITALVETPTAPELQPDLGASLMRSRPEVEQVGFFSVSEEPGIQAELRMAGGEFCGNASMSAAALYLLKNPAKKGPVFLKVSGADEPVEVEIEKTGDLEFQAGVRMPRPKSVRTLPFSCPADESSDSAAKGMLPLCEMEGISHIIIEESSPFFRLKEEPEIAEEAVRRWCRELHAEGLGLMFLSESAEGMNLTPLVFVPGSDTIFWENSCASGSAAAAMYFASKNSEPVSLLFREPGGVLRAESDPKTQETRLYGKTRLIV